MSAESDTLEYIEDSLTTIEGLEKDKEELTAKVAELTGEKVRLEKVASESLSSERVESVVERLVKLAYINPLYADQVSEKINSDPNVVLDLLEKISEASVALPSSGRGIAKEGSEQEPDPDGWTSLARTNRKY